MPIQAKQTTHQRLILAPNITLALEVLRMPVAELQAFLRQQAEENPLLELEELEEEPGDLAPVEANHEDPGPESSQGPDEEWLDLWEGGAAREASEEAADRRGLAVEQRLTKPESFHESLRLQWGCQRLSAEERALGEAIIDRLDEFGYLDGTLEELAGELGRPVDRLEAALRMVQRLDPPGIGARDLRECLLLQLEAQGAPDGLASRILRDHFPLFVQHQLAAIARATASSPEEVAAAVVQLKRLDPKPGRAFTGELPPSAVPDLVVVRGERHYDVELNDQAVPQVRVNRTYHRMLKHPTTPPDAREFLTGKFRRAAWLIKAIDERNATLLAIGRCLISLQRDFLERGPNGLKPLTQAQVAGLVGRHPSTVSRAIAGKTIDTPYGLFRLEELFATSVPQGPNGAAVSDAAIKTEIARLIEGEDARRPLSDEAIARRLAERQVAVARRTVAKYRTSLKILPAHLRRRR